MQVQGSPSQLGRELWSKYCASELSHMGWKWLILYILVLFSHRIQAALGRHKAAQADPEEAVSCRFLLTTLPAAGQQILPWSGVWVVHLCICHKLKLATTQMSISWREVKFCCSHDIPIIPQCFLHAPLWSIHSRATTDPSLASTWFGRSLILVLLVSV